MKYNKIFIDLDGTLIDIKQRLYNVFSYITQREDVSYEEYWKLRRDGMKQGELLRHLFQYNEGQIESFRKQWMQLIESKEWLKCDVPQAGALSLLESIADKTQLYLWTNRQSRTNTEWQVDSLGWTGMFAEMLVTEQTYGKDILLKSVLEESDKILIISDTMEDCKIASELGYDSIMVDSEMYRREPKDIIEKVCYCKNLMEVKEYMFNGVEN